MRRTVPMRIGDLLGEFVKETPAVARGLTEARVSGLWPVVVGPAVAARTVKVSMRNGVFTAWLDSSVARNALFMQRDALRDALNKAAGADIVRTVILK